MATGFSHLATVSLLLSSLAAASAASLLSPITVHDPWNVAVHTCPRHIPAPLLPHGQFGCPAAVDDEVARKHGPTAWSAWTHAPFCLASNSRAPEDVLATRPRQFCVYTNAQHGTGGLSVVTTPETAAGSVIPLLDEEMWSAAQTTTTTTTLPPPYDVVDLGTKGKGLVATRRIKAHELILSDYAALVVDMAVPEALLREDGYRLLAQAAGQLAQPQRVRGLAQTNTAARHPVENVLRSNAYHTMLGGRGHMTIFPELSRINHACMPNAFARFHAHSLGVSVAAVKEIEPGEEITISYIELGLTRDERRKQLLRWEFLCDCPLCRASDDHVRASDKRRTAIARLRRQAVAAFQGGDAEASLRITRALGRLLHDEEMFSLYAENEENLARIYWALGEYEEAERLAQQSLDTLVAQGYIAKADTALLDRLLDDFADEA